MDNRTVEYVNNKLGNLELLIAVQQQNMPRDLRHHKYDEAVGYGEIQKLANAFKARTQTLVADRDLSDDGKRRKLTEYAREIFGEVKIWRERHKAGFDANIATRTQALRAATARPVPSDPLERLAREIRLSEIRRALDGLDRTQLQALYFSAKGEVREAIETGPPRVERGENGVIVHGPMIAPELVERRAAEEAHAANPALAEQLDEIQTIAGANDALAATLMRALADVTERYDSAHDLKAAI